VGPFIVSGIDPLKLVITTRLNGTVKQNGSTSDMAFSVPFLIRYIARVMTLHPGDLIATGTPAGVSPMKNGDIVEVEIEEIGVLRNTICDANSGRPG
jgi:2-keto-4-pentenoate hydratase/2-oxohepta-3-ene-1,7-dioic acid hydratase in catechol pathway